MVVSVGIVGMLVATGCTTTAPSTVPGTSCPLLPANNVWRADVSHLPVHARSAAYVANIGSTSGLKADFGSGEWDGGPIGIPFTTVPGSQPKVRVTFDYDEDSDPGPYPIPASPPIEGGASSDGDRHVIVVDRGTCTLYETWDSHPNGDGSWHAGSGAVFDLRSNALRPAGYTSADAAGLPILPGLVTYDEVRSGTIDHAIRVTVPRSQRAYLWPARHQASSSTDPNLPPMGLRLRLKADVDISRYSPDARVILQAAKTYGLIVADNGSAWYISGAPDERWENDVLQTLRGIKGSSFEAVDESSLMVSANSAAVR